MSKRPEAGRIHADATALSQFYDCLFAPLNLAVSGYDPSHFRSSIGWLARALGRPPLLSDLTRENLAAALAYAAEAGIGRGRLKDIRNQLRRIHRYAATLALLPPYENVPLPRVKAPAADPGPPPSPRDGILSKHYLERVRPELRARRSRRHINSCDRTVIRFEEFCRRHWTGKNISAETVDAFVDHLREEGKSERTRQQFRSIIRRVLRGFVPTLIDKPNPAKPKKKIQGQQQGFYDRLPPPPAGSLREYFEATYRPQVLLGGSRTNLQRYKQMLLELRQHAGRDVALGELTNDLAAQFFAAQFERGLSATSVNNTRAVLRAVWTHAFDRGKVAEPLRIKKFKAERETPDAWTREELRRILAACDQVPFEEELRWQRVAGGIPFGEYWRALLLVGYQTGLRRRSLFELRTADLDTAGGWLWVPAGVVKTKSAKTYKLGAEALAAVAAIFDPQREMLFPFQADVNTAYRYLKLILQTAGIAPSRRKAHNNLFHKLRRTTASHLWQTAGMAAVVEILDHSEGEVTRRYLDPRFAPRHDVSRLFTLGLFDGSQPAAGHDVSVLSLDENEKGVA